MNRDARVLVAILLNPPTGSGVRTRERLQIVAGLLECGEVVVENLFPYPTKDTAELATLHHEEQQWTGHRQLIANAVERADEVLIGWGMVSLPGAARRLQRNQIDWVRNLLLVHGRTVWSIGPDARHPSRWHQFLSDRHGRSTGGSLRDRLAESLQRVEPLLSESPSRLTTDGNVASEG